MESMLCYLKGINRQVEVYNNMIIITKRTYISQDLVDSKNIPFNFIKDIQYKLGSTFSYGYIQFNVELQGEIINKYKIIIKQIDNQIALEIKDFIENKIFSKNENNVKSEEKISIADEIIKYKKLLDKGIINQKEFERKKNELLNL